MTTLMDHIFSLNENGFTVVEPVFSDDELSAISSAIDAASHTTSNFRRSSDVFAIRKFLKEVPAAAQLLFNEKLKGLIKDMLGEGLFAVKSIYFDKPKQSNWFVAWHQDLMIFTDKKLEIPGYSPWVKKDGCFSVQPPVDVLESIYTVRIHLDDTTEDNGALKVIPRSHKKGIYRPENIDWMQETEVTCSVAKGGVMVMRPLLLHSSARTTNNNSRRVIHIELSGRPLATGLDWAERFDFATCTAK